MSVTQIRPTRDRKWASEAVALLKQVDRQRARLEELIAEASSDKPETAFQFYEEVRVISKKKAHHSIANRLGLIVGKSQAEDGSWVYAVAVEGDETWSLERACLESTGRLFDRSSVYSGDSVQVSVDSQGNSKRIS